MYSLQSETPRGWLIGIYRRIPRLLVPWAVWSLVYMMANAYMNRSIDEFFGFRTLLYGGEVHLWFLPFIFILIACMDAFGRALRFFGIESLMAQMLSGLLTLLAAYGVMGLAPIVVPYPQWAFGMISVALGWVMLYTFFRGAEHSVSALSRLLVGLVVACGGGMTLGSTLSDMLAQLLGCGMVLVVMLIPCPPSIISSLGRKYSLYVYLAHGIAALVWYKAFGIQGDLSVLLIFVAALLTGGLLSWVTRQSKRRMISRVRTAIGL